MEIREVFDNLTDEDDKDCWNVVLNEILGEVEKEAGTLVEIGRCSHWIRPHDQRWRADGALRPHGYNPTVEGYSYRALPQFDWSSILEWNGQAWEGVRRRSEKVVARIAVPARTMRHQQATVHVLWMDGKEKEEHFYGFRKKEAGWTLTATTRGVREDAMVCVQALVYEMRFWK